MNKEQKLDLLRQTGLIAIMRANSSDQLIAAADAIRGRWREGDRSDHDDPWSD